MILVGILVAACNGRIGSVGTAAIDSSKDAVMLCITMLGVMSMWTGLMNIAKKAGIIDRLTKGLRPVLAFLFPLHYNSLVIKYVLRGGVRFPTGGDSPRPAKCS